MSRYQLETRLGLLHFSLSNSRCAEHTFKIQRAIEATQRALDAL